MIYIKNLLEQGETYCTSNKTQEPIVYPSGKTIALLNRYITRNRMSQLPDHIFIAFGAITAAVIAGIFSYITLVAAKESKISEFRQNWINDLRNEISKYISSINGLIEYLRITNRGQALLPIKAMDKKNDKSDLYSQMLNSKISILLRINDNEKDEKFKKINDKVLEHVENIYNDFENGRFNDAETKINKLVSKSRELLKYEWDRVRDGERNYAKTKKVALVTVIISIILLIGMTLLKTYDFSINEETSLKIPEKLVNQDINESNQTLINKEQNKSLIKVYKH